jgi:O-antigen/teichoic acid export membrane protein
VKDDKKLSRQIVGKNATYLYIESIIGLFVAYFLWLVLSRLTSPDVIGVSSTIITLATIFAVVVDLGVSAGSTRFLGRNFAEGKLEDAKMIIKASFLVTGVSLFVSVVIILVLKDIIYPTNIGFDLILMSLLLLTIYVIAFLMRSILVASVDTKSLPKIAIVNSICKVSLTLTLIFLGTGAIGVTIGYMSGYVPATILLSIIIFTIMRPVKKKESALELYTACKNILFASVPVWIPKVITIIGSRLGIVVVFGFDGASQAGSYFIAFSIFHAITALVESLFSIGFPIISAMHDQRKRFVWRLIKMSLIVSLPISSAVILYSDEIMGLLGPQYIEASISLKIITLSMLTYAFTMGITYLVYAYGNYLQVLAIGLGSSVPRILLYFIFVPLYGNTGAAITYTIGSVIAFSISIIVTKKIGMLIFWKELALIFFIPTGIIFVLDYFQVNYMVGIPAIFGISLLLFSLLRILSKTDLRDLLSVIPDNISKPLVRILDKL